MATIEKRTTKDGKIAFRVKIRLPLVPDERAYLGQFIRCNTQKKYDVVGVSQPAPILSVCRRSVRQVGTLGHLGWLINEMCALPHPWL